MENKIKEYLLEYSIYARITDYVDKMAKDIAEIVEIYKRVIEE